MKLSKFIAFLLCGALLLTLWACGDPPPTTGNAGSSREPLETAALADREDHGDKPDELQEQTPHAVTTRRVVCAVWEKSLLTLPQEGEYGELSFVALANPDETAGKLAPGAVIDVVYDGDTLETFPASLSGVQSVTVVEQRESLLPFYLGVLEDLYADDPGLNPDGTQHDVIYYGFNLTGVRSLTEQEKTALAYLFLCSHNETGNADYIMGTFRELCDEGFIDEENLCWENGMLFTITDEAAKNGRFTFSVEKWRSGLGAVGWDNCTAERKGDEWIYTPGTFWIS